MTGPGGFERKRFRRREIVYAIDDLAPRVHVIATGRVKVYRLSEDGREIILGILGKGALFAGGRYDSIAETIEAMETTFVANTVVRDRLEHDPAPGWRCLRSPASACARRRNWRKGWRLTRCRVGWRTCCWN